MAKETQATPAVNDLDSFMYVEDSENTYRRSIHLPKNKPRQALRAATSTLPKRVSTRCKCTTCGSSLPSKVKKNSPITNNCGKSYRRTPAMGGLKRSVAATTSQQMPPCDARGKPASLQRQTSTVANRSSASSNVKKVSLLPRRRIPDNAGIPANAGMRRAFNNLRRKLMDNTLDSDNSIEIKPRK